MFFVKDCRQDYKYTRLYGPGCGALALMFVIFICGWGTTNNGQGPIGLVIRWVLSLIALVYLTSVLWRLIQYSGYEHLISKAVVKRQTAEHRKLIEVASKQLVRRTARGNKGLAEANRLLRMAAIALAFGIDLDDVNAHAKKHLGENLFPAITYDATYRGDKEKRGGYLRLDYDYVENRKRVPLKKSIKIW